MSKNAIAATIAATLVSGAGAVASAGARPAHHFKVAETQRIAQVAIAGTPGTASARVISAGTIDGRIGRHPITGALRASGQITSATTSVVHGTEFDAGGSRSFVLHISFVIANGTVTDHGKGRWTGGTGRYVGARGTFTLEGSRPVNGASDLKLRGSISY